MRNAVATISYPEPANFLRRMLDENEGDWLSKMQCNTIRYLRTYWVIWTQVWTKYRGGGCTARTALALVTCISVSPTTATTTAEAIDEDNNRTTKTPVVATANVNSGKISSNTQSLPIDVF